MYAFNTSRNPLQPYLVFHSILNLLQKTYFWANFNSFFYIILSYLVKNSLQRNMNRRGEKRAGAGREKSSSFTKISRKWIKNIGEQIIVIFINLENRWKRLHMLARKIKLSRPWTFDNDSCRLRVISHLCRWSNSEVFVDVWLSLEKSIGEFSMVYKTMPALIWLSV